MIKIFIIEDEISARIGLISCISRYCPGYTVIGESSSAVSSIPQILLLKPEIVLLDINLGSEFGFDLFDSIPDPTFVTIIITAHSEHAIKAIHNQAIDFILKPISVESLLQALNRARIKIDKNRKLLDREDYKILLETQKFCEKISLPILDGVVYVDLHEIVRCEAENNYTEFHFLNKTKILVCKTLGYYELLLKPKYFYRVHNHHLINMAYIVRLQRGRGGAVFLQDGTEIVVSQRKRDDFIKALNAFFMLN